MLLDGSAGEELVCNAGDPASIPGLGRSPGEGIGYPFQCSWASLVAQLVKNLPAMRETWVQSLGWEDLPTGLENSMDTVHGVTKSRTRLNDFHFLQFLNFFLFLSFWPCQPYGAIWLSEVQSGKINGNEI